MGYICKNNGIYSEKPLDILSKKFGIYWVKTIDNFMGCIRKICRIYFAKPWDILVHWIY